LIDLKMNLTEWRQMKNFWSIKLLIRRNRYKKKSTGKMPLLIQLPFSKKFSRMERVMMN
jgi:hypothetical protein